MIHRDRTLLVVGCLLIAVATVSWLLWTSGPGTATDLHQSEVVTERALDPTPPIVDHDPDSTAALTPKRSESESTAEDTEADVAPVPCGVLGRVVGEEGEPLEGIEVGLDQRFYTTTGRDGRFVLEDPRGSLRRVQLIVYGSQFHSSALLTFSNGRESDLAPLQEGDNEVGDIRLFQGGAVTGFVRDEAGTPIANARVNIDGGDSLPGEVLSSPGETDAQGRYLKGRIPPGTCHLEASAVGYFSEQGPEVTIEAGRTHAGYDIVLRPAQTVAGRVVGEDGSPIGGLRVCCFPVRGGGAEVGVSDALGRFVVVLNEDSPVQIFLESDEYDLPADPERLVLEPGTDDAELVLTRARTVRFLALDDQSDTPITRFGVLTLERGSTTSALPDYEDAQDGRITRRVHPDGSSVKFSAPGYAPGFVPVVPDRPGGDTMTLRFKRGARITGRLVFRGDPVGDVLVKVEPRSREIRDVITRHMGTRSNDDGSFQIGGLLPGVYQIQFISDEAGVRTIDREVVKIPSIVDLGVIRLAPSGTVEGVVVAVGADVTGLRVDLDGGGTETVGADGRFRFTRLDEGAHQLTVRAPDSRIAEGPPFQFNAVADEVTKVVLDVSHRVKCRLTIRVTSDGKPVAGVGASMGSPAFLIQQQLAPSGPDGVIAESVVPAVSERVFLQARSGCVLKVLEGVSLPAGGLTSLDAEIATASLTVRFPDGFDPSAEDTAEIALSSRENANLDHKVIFARPDTEWSFLGNLWEGRDIAIATVPAGRCDVVVTTSSPARETAGQPVKLVFRGSVNIAAGVTAECQLEQE